MQEPDTDKDLYRTSLESVDPVAGRTASLRHYAAYLNWSEDNENKMQPTNPNTHTHVNGTDVETHGYAVTQNTFLQ